MHKTKDLDIIDFEQVAERLISISKKKPLLPEQYIDWTVEPDKDTIFMPEHLVSLSGHPLWNSLSQKQKVELGRLEMVQVMYSYAWSETLACYFFNRHLLTLNPDSVEYRFIIRELIEECRHQEMFGMAIRKLERKPVLPTRLHKFFGYLTVKWFPPSLVFMSVLAVELMADTYAKHIRKNKLVYSVLRESSELHHIEEGRHIYYTRLWLNKFTNNAGFLKSTIYSFIMMLNVLFMRTLYIKKEFFQLINVDDPQYYFSSAIKNYNEKFGLIAKEAVYEVVNDFNGFNWLTKPFWNKLLKLKV